MEPPNESSTPHLEKGDLGSLANIPLMALDVFKNATAETMKNSVKNFEHAQEGLRAAAKQLSDAGVFSAGNETSTPDGNEPGVPNKAENGTPNEAEPNGSGPKETLEENGNGNEALDQVIESLLTAIRMEVAGWMHEAMKASVLATVEKAVQKAMGNWVNIFENAQEDLRAAAKQLTDAAMMSAGSEARTPNGNGVGAGSGGNIGTNENGSEVPDHLIKSLRVHIRADVADWVRKAMKASMPTMVEALLRETRWRLNQPAQQAPRVKTSAK